MSTFWKWAIWLFVAAWVFHSRRTDNRRDKEKYAPIPRRTRAKAATTENHSRRSRKSRKVNAVAHIRKVKAAFRIKYEDMLGNITERDLDVQEIIREDDIIYLAGHCHLRDAYRTFRIDRISECISRDTGEIIEDIQTFLDRVQK